MLKKRKKKRKCPNCGEMYMPDPRTRDRQKYCSATECRLVSKNVSQRCWLSKPANKDYFRGPENSARVKLWRGAHPEYWKRCPKTQNALQDDCSLQVVAGEDDTGTLEQNALQDDCLLQPSLIVGLIAHLTESALQDDIAVYVRKMHSYGQSILGIGPGIKKGEKGYDRKKSTLSRKDASYPIQV